jgi:hypothetical protein
MKYEEHKRNAENRNVKISSPVLTTKDIMIYRTYYSLATVSTVLRYRACAQSTRRAMYIDIE